MKTRIITIVAGLSIIGSVCADSISGPEGHGEALVYSTRNGAIVSISGEAAKTLFSLLPVDFYIPTASSSQVKDYETSQCTKNDNDYHCIIGIGE